jgi:hypothetical protein
MTRAQEFALDALVRETRRIERKEGMRYAGGETEWFVDDVPVETITTRLTTAWTCYGQGHFREAVMALMDS